MSIVQSLDDLNLDFIARGQQSSVEYEEAVKLIQTALKKDGNYGYLIDGDLGGRTDMAIRSFQQEHGLRSDGKVGPQTAALLDKVLQNQVVDRKQSSIPYAADYIAKWNKMVIKPSQIPAIDQVIKVLLDTNHLPKYKQIEAATGVPIAVTAVIHERESAGRLNTYLGNGQSLAYRTTIVPKGRGPFTGPNAFVDGALDAYKLQKMFGLDWYDGTGIARASYILEGFNGFGYRNRGLPTPYLYAGTNLQKPGKYVSDGKFSATTWDTQLGAMAIFKRMIELHPELALERKP